MPCLRDTVPFFFSLSRSEVLGYFLSALCGLDSSHALSFRGAIEDSRFLPLVGMAKVTVGTTTEWEAE